MKAAPIPRRGGFTLVELLVSIAVLSLLTFALLNILNASANAWSRSEQVGETLREARGAIDLMSRDFQAMAIDDNKPSEGAKYDAVDARSKPDIVLYGRDSVFANLQGSDQTAGRDPQPVAVTFAAGTTVPSPGHGDAIFFLARQTSLAQPPDDPANNVAAKSDLCTIGYYLAYTADNASAASPKSFKLYRHLRGGKETFQRLSGTLPSGSKDIQPDATKDDVLARNVIDLKIRLYRLPPGTGPRALVDVNPWPTRVFVNNEVVSPSAPAVIEVEFTCLGNRAAGTLPDQAAWEGSPRFANLLASQKQTYKFRVYVRR